MLFPLAQKFAILIAIMAVRNGLSLFIYSNQLIFLLKIKVLTFNHDITIPYNVLKHNSKQHG